MPQVDALNKSSPQSAPQKQYWRDGYLFPVTALSPDAAAAYRAELEAIEANWLNAGLPQPLNTYKRVNAHVVMPTAHRLASEPAVLDAVQGILGPDILIYSAEYFIKEPNSGQIVTMHQDLTYWGLGAIDGLVTAWIALSPATNKSGCMQFVAASHNNPILPHDDTFDANNLLSRGQEVQVDVPAKDRVAIELAPGLMSLHHGLMIHGSGPNTTDDRRIGVAIRYVRPDMRPDAGHTAFAVLARGRDGHGNFTLTPPPAAPFTPESLAIYDEIRTEQVKVTMAGAKQSADMYARTSA